VVNPTAGLLEGDRVEIEVRVESGARLLLTSPSATRIHTMKGGHASTVQKFLVARGARLEVLPDLLIPQKDAAYEQTTEIHVEAGGELFFYEILTPGRVASGEAFAFARLDWSTDLFVGGVLAARERYRLAPNSPALYSLEACFPHAYQANAFVCHEALTEQASCWKTLLALQNDDALIGFSRLHRAGWVIKVLARDSRTIRRVLEEIRDALHEAIGSAKVVLRKN
jgi:urease accessory protein